MPRSDSGRPAAWGGLKGPEITIRAFRAEDSSLLTRNTRLEVFAKAALTTPAQAMPAPSPPQLRRGVKVSNSNRHARKPALLSPIPATEGFLNPKIRRDHFIPLAS
jgi:hypothetical protein